jgi:hypothetical protein
MEVVRGLSLVSKCVALLHARGRARLHRGVGFVGEDPQFHRFVVLLHARGTRVLTFHGENSLRRSCMVQEVPGSFAPLRMTIFI